MGYAEGQRASLGRLPGSSVVLGATLAQPQPVQGVTPVVAPGCRRLSSRGRQPGSGALESLQSRHVLRESNDLRLCGLDVGCAPSGRAAGPQGLDSFSSPATLRATISRSQHQRADRNLPREVRFVSAAPPSGACSIRGAPLFERCATLQALCMTPTCEPGPFGGPGRPLRPTPATDLPLF